MGIITAENLTLVLGDKIILNNLSLDLWEGHVHAIVGPNGAGKSSLSYTIMGLSGYENYEGDLYFRGEPLRNLPIHERARRGITLGWQEPARFEGLSIRSFLTASSKEKSPAAIADALSRVGLDPDEYLDRAVDRTLSGGERKRIELASLLVMRPRLVLLDEPDSGIDVEALEKIFECIRFFREDGATVVLITHSLAVLKQAEHAFLMCHGEIFDKGPVEKIRHYFENKCIPCVHKNMPLENETI